MGDAVPQWLTQHGETGVMGSNPNPSPFLVHEGQWGNSTIIDIPAACTISSFGCRILFIASTQIFPLPVYLPRKQKLGSNLFKQALHQSELKSRLFEKYAVITRYKDARMQEHARVDTISWQPP
jgi:hypothetical protein